MLELLSVWEDQVMLRPGDLAVRPQIEAVKAHLLAEGLTDILEPAGNSKEGYHSFRSTHDTEIRLLWISYQWLSDNPKPGAVVAYLQGKQIAHQLMTDTYSATIHDGGTVQTELLT